MNIKSELCLCNSWITKLWMVRCLDRHPEVRLPHDYLWVFTEQVTLLPGRSRDLLTNSISLDIPREHLHALLTPNSYFCSQVLCTTPFHPVFEK